MKKEQRSQEKALERLYVSPHAYYVYVGKLHDQTGNQTQAITAPMVGSECPRSSGGKRAMFLYVGELLA